MEAEEWWDSHDITGYLDELRPVLFLVSPIFTTVHSLTVVVDSAGWQTLGRSARDRGMEPAKLASLGLAERLGQEIGSEQASGSPTPTATPRASVGWSGRRMRRPDTGQQRGRPTRLR